MKKKGRLSHVSHKHHASSFMQRLLYAITRSYVMSGIASVLFVSVFVGMYLLVTLPSAPVVLSTLLSCTDLEREVDAFRAGPVVLKYDSNLSVYYNDVCLSEQELEEQYCTGGTFEKRLFSCDAGCFEGACIVPTSAISLLATSVEKASCTGYSLLSPYDALASSELAPEYSALHALDGDTSTSWFGVGKGVFPQWIRFDVREARCVTGVRLQSFVHDGIQPLTIGVSKDGLHWETVISQGTSSATPLYYSFNATYFVRYVRVHILNSSRPYGSLSEVVFNMSELYPLSYTVGDIHA